ncbi:uncharacterized protein LOC122643675 [Telopea speciosissima]|uniref:uncharacterized protein LOC122643675 n=1 Tax=Telopea speciosissima TaxID=54955 RepID=UPI001CC7CF59|nr:uncharacterized protein LOC122643675 [Telopea speciosissima]
MAASHNPERPGNSDPSTNTDVPVPRLDFRCPTDDAWYGVQLLLQGDTLTVNYNDFSQEFDEHFCASEFKTLTEINTFKYRFRPASVQLQDHQCSQVSQGMVVCISHTYSDDDLLFYDAFIDNVDHKEHYYVNGEEECSCEFKVLWRHGPLDGIYTQTKIGNICIIQSGGGEGNATLASFLKISREKLEMASPSTFSIPRSGGSICKDASNGNHDSTVQRKQSTAGCTSKVLVSYFVENSTISTLTH